jgi:hypothetical protein
VGGANTQVLFNDAGACAGDAGLTYNKTTDSISIGGQVLTPVGSATTPPYSFSAYANTGFWAVNANLIGITLAGTHTYQFTNTAFALSLTAGIAWYDFVNPPDLRLYREGASVLQVSSGALGSYASIKAKNVTATAAMTGAYTWLGMYTGGLDFRNSQTYGVQAGSTVTAMTAADGQVCRIIIGNGGSIALPAVIKWATGAPAWGTTYTILTFWHAGGVFWGSSMAFTT